MYTAILAPLTCVIFFCINGVGGRDGEGFKWIVKI